MFTKETPYLALMGELWGVFCEGFGENWPCYNDTALYMGIFICDFRYFVHYETIISSTV